MKTSYLAGIVVALLVLGLLWWVFSQPPPKTDSRLAAFARCLADKKVTMYGAQWCAHCQNQKSLFGESFRLVPYVECPVEIKKCLALGIDKYPTWIMPGGARLEGQRNLEELAAASGCALITNSNK